jgi:hypothetical protein
VSGATARALDPLELAFDQLRCFAMDPLASADDALAGAPELVMGHVLRAYLFLLSSEGIAVGAARSALQAALVLPHNEREAMHLRAISQWCAGQWRAAGRTLEDLSVDWPRDALALQMGQQLDYFTGDIRMLHDRMARALPHWSASLPGWHALLGMLAFGLEENGHHAAAEEAGRQAVALQPRDAWAQHAVAHVLEMQGRHDEGITWMRDHPAWQRESLLAVHNGWHLALHHMALDDIDAVLDLYDGPIHNHDTVVQLELVDASALLWRLQLRGVTLGQRWQALAERWALATCDGWFAFNDWHAAMAYVGAGRQDLLEAVASAQAESLARDDDSARFTREVGLAATQGIVAYGQQDWARAADLLRSVRSVSHRFGGSHAQRDLIDLTLLDAARRSGWVALATALQDERTAAARQRRRVQQALSPALLGTL